VPFCGDARSAKRPRTEVTEARSAARVEPLEADDPSRILLWGAPASEGAASTAAFAFFPEALAPPAGVVAPHEVEGELWRLRNASARVADELAQKKQSAAPGTQDALIVDALGEIARDDSLLNRIEMLIRQGADVASAALQAGGELAREFARTEDAYLRSRSRTFARLPAISRWPRWARWSSA
jgi:phosphoenolpyruvate-protein kinase (PTS system EI component)